jgi:hypothetical protein
VLLTALIDQLLIADYIFWMNSKIITASILQKGCDRFKTIGPKVHKEVEEMLAKVKNDVIFDLKVVKAPIHEIISKNRYTPGLELPHVILREC